MGRKLEKLTLGKRGIRLESLDPDPDPDLDPLSGQIVTEARTETLKSDVR